MSSYFPYSEGRRGPARVTLFCLPHAGSGASVYHDWQRQFPPDIGIEPVQLPGREGLLRHPLLTDAHELAELLGTAIAPRTSRPYALFGHSMGALLAAEITAWLDRRGHDLPRLLVVSGRGAPAPRESGVLADFDRDDVLRRIVSLGGTPPDALLHEELRELVLRISHADFTLCATYQPSFRQLTVPVLAFGGDSDPDVPAAALSAWSRSTTGPCRVHILSGGHFFVRDQLASVAAQIVRELRGILQQG